MRIGVINQLGGRPGGDTPPPSRESIKERASTAEASGFDMFAFGRSVVNFPYRSRRISRFAEAIQVIHGLLKTGRVDFEGEFHTAIQSELVLRGPRPEGPRS